MTNRIAFAGIAKMGRPKGTGKADDRKVLKLLSLGFDHQEIAQRLGISTKSVQRSARRWGVGTMTDEQANHVVFLAWFVCERDPDLMEGKWRTLDFYIFLKEKMPEQWPQPFDFLAIGRAVRRRMKDEDSSSENNSG